MARRGPLDGAFGVPAEGHVVGGEAGDRLDRWWVSIERRVFGGAFGVLGDSRIADTGLDPREQRCTRLQPKVIVAEPVDRRFEPGDDLERMAAPEPEGAQFDDDVGDDGGLTVVVVPVEHQAQVLDVSGEPLHGGDVARPGERRRVVTVRAR